ncbi:dipeptidase [Roseivirga sp. BDSF3-8]|uniref:dipeptidase n=1 Tax=Roseivirga sp. BDSF3-8 TaxID=3241598 RepID=UPI003531ED2D
MKRYPVFDLHCDLLSYLASRPNSNPSDADDIGCAIPFLQRGRVRWQVLAIYSGTEKGSAHMAGEQVNAYRRLINNYGDVFTPVTSLDDANALTAGSKIGVTVSIENASGLCEEDETLERAFERLENIIEATGRVIYIGLTHHGENRFGGGNTTTAGLKDDGKALLEYLNGRKIAIDLAHTSDALAHGILDYLTKKSLDVPVIASHSNFRQVFEHPRNLPEELVKEVISRKGLIGMNFLRAYVNNDDPDALRQHILHGFNHGAKNAIAFGADYFYTKDHPDPTRIPFYFPEHASAERYPNVLESLQGDLSDKQLTDLAFGNVLQFVNRVWNEG